VTIARNVFHPRSDHLRDVDDEKHDVAHRQPEVLPTRPLVAAEQSRKPGELHRLVDRDTRHERRGAHQDDRCVRDLLRAIELPRRQLDSLQVQIVKQNAERLRE
jgi:hypothetical protein